MNLLKAGNHYCKDLQEDYYIACLQQKGVNLYNSTRDKNCKENFFVLSCRIDKRITDIIKNINT